VNYTPTFKHTNWIDRLDRVDAEGSNGFNNRFDAIGADLRQLSTVVSQIGTAINEFQAPPAAAQQLVSFTPVLRAVPPAIAWTNDPDGTALAQAGQFGGDQSIFGLMNLTLPDRVRLTTMRVLGDLIPDDTGQATGNVSLFRAPLRLTTSAPTTDRLVSVDNGGVFGSFDLRSSANSAFAQIDLSTFRYFITATFTTPADVFPTTSMLIEAVQLTFTPV
jgi:hypothetical protein